MKANNKSSKKYNPSEIEKKWQKVWDEKKIFSPNLNKAKKPFYNLMMFPYPSAEGMHVGNMYAFVGADVFGRFMRMKGFDVFEPIGLDGFGIHSENYALKVGTHPAKQAKISEVNFYRQLRAIGNSFDWTRTVETYDPNYYRWTQWIFVKMFQNGLVYREKATVNWCPSDKTVLADEQVIDGKCERDGAVIEKRQLEQWFFKITKYADRLLANIDRLNWSEKVKIAQRQWIGKSEGVRIEFIIPSNSADRQNSEFRIEVFTTRPDTLYGATFLVLAPEHPLVLKLASVEYLESLKRYLDVVLKKSDTDRQEAKEKSGVFTGSYAINPANSEKIPIWVADYVLMGYGTGAVMGVPGSDHRDFEFAKKFKLPIKQVISKDGQEQSLDEAYTGEGKIINSKDWNGFNVPKDIDKVIDWLQNKGLGKKETTYHLRDWLISRQRYWGPPIPMVYCASCAEQGKSWFTTPEAESHYREISNPPGRAGKSQISNKKEIGNWKLEIGNLSEAMKGWYTVAEKELPVNLPFIEDYKPLGTGKSPLANHPEFYEVKCPKCGGKAKRETDVSDTFLDSAWYFFRYVSTDTESKVFDAERVKKWLPVNMYIGGAEHSVLHLLYSRFVTMFLKDAGLIGFEEPFSRFYAHGLIIKEGAKMSKSRENVVVPDSYIQKYGADAFRTYLMFIGPFSQGGDFRDTGIDGMERFLQRVWKLISDGNARQPHVAGDARQANSKDRSNNRSLNQSLSSSSDSKNSRPALGSPASGLPSQAEALTMMHKTIKKVTEDLEELRYNTAIASLMEWYNFLTRQEKVSEDEKVAFLKLFAPFAPHMTEELWEQLIIDNLQFTNEARKDSKTSIINSKSFKSIHFELWPEYDEKYLKEDEVTVVVQVNGKVRDSIKVKSEKLKVKSEVQEAAKTEKVKKYLEEKKISKVIYVEGKIINFVTE